MQDQVPLKCPKCTHEFQVTAQAVIPAIQKLRMTLKQMEGSPGMSAETVGKSILNFQKLMSAVAKDIGAKIHVFVTEISYRDGTLEVEFLMTEVK
jgi:hypothetical protein